MTAGENSDNKILNIVYRRKSGRIRWNLIEIVKRLKMIFPCLKTSRDFEHTVLARVWLLLLLVQSFILTAHLTRFKSRCSFAVISICYKHHDMKQLHTILLLSFFFANGSTFKAWSQTSKWGVEEKSFTDYRELESFKNYEKVSDTAFAVSGYDNTHRITFLRNKKTTMILFSEVSLDDMRREHYRLLDTLQLAEINPHRVTIGYCYKENLHEEQIIGIVERVEGIHIINLLRAWKADTQTGRIEELKDLEGIKCLNEF